MTAMNIGTDTLSSHKLSFKIFFKQADMVANSGWMVTIIQAYPYAYHL